MNITVPDPDATAALLCELFGWHIRWQGPARGAAVASGSGTVMFTCSSRAVISGSLLPLGYDGRQDPTSSAVEVKRKVSFRTSDLPYRGAAPS